MVKVIYCGHSLQAEAELNRQGEWIGQCVVGGSAFTRTIMLYTPIPHFGLRRRRSTRY
jgi:hypothetical protein